MKRCLIIGLFILGSTLAAPCGDSWSQRDDTEDTFDYFENNWNTVGLKDYTYGSRISANNELFLTGRIPLQVRIGRELKPLSREHGKQALDGWMPIFIVDAEDGPVRYEVKYWATPLPSVKDWEKAFDWPTEEDNFLDWISVKATNTSSQAVEAKADVRPLPPPKNTSAGDVSGPETDKHKRQHSWLWKLGPGESAVGVARYTFLPVDDPTKYDQEDADRWFQRTVEYWRNLMNRSATIRVPCRKANNALLAAHVCQFLANDRGEIRGGEGLWDAIYIRSEAYQLMEMEEAGFTEFCSKAMEFFLKRQQPGGLFISQGTGDEGRIPAGPTKKGMVGELDGNGQALWTLWQYWKITGDRAFLERVYPQMRRAANWIRQARRQAPADSPYAGLLPAAIADGENLLDEENHIVGYDFWNLRGLICAADAARSLGKSDDEKELLAEVKDYRAAIDAAWKRTGVPYFPPTWENNGTHWGNTETLWPTELFARDDPRVVALIDHVRHEWGGGYIEGTIQWRGNEWKFGNMVGSAIHPYMGAYTTMADLTRGRDEQVVEDFYWYLLHSTAANGFAEGILYNDRHAWGHVIPHPNGASNFALMLRHMLVHEAGDELHLLSAVPDGWLDAGQEIRLERLPTYFGPMELIVRGTPKGVEVRLTPPTRQAPKRIVLHLPTSRPLIGSLKGVEVALRKDQSVRWDFTEVLKRYRKLQRGGDYDAKSLTTGKPATCSAALPGNSASLANDGYKGDTGRFWATDAAQDKETWWQVDLGSENTVGQVTVGRVVVVGYYGDNRSYGFTVETSTDGKTWTRVADRRDNKEPSTKDGYTCKFEPVKTRFIRITMTGNSANTGRHLVEVMAYEE